jgi:membrane-bound lytic murein transglycosylase D
MGTINIKYILTLFTGLAIAVSIAAPAYAGLYVYGDSLVQKKVFTDSLNMADHDSLLRINKEKLNDRAVAEEILDHSQIADRLDELVGIRFFRESYFTTDTLELNIYGFDPDEVPSYPDSIYEQRIATLNEETPIELTYNRTVKSYIDLYAVKKRELTSRMLGMAEVYFPLFEEYLDRYDLPLELKYLAIVESALNPRAGSHAGAKGLWQFMYYTGKIYGLKVTSLIDERYDPYLATDAACRHMKDLHDIYGDWNLVMAAYNSGAGNVNKAIRRAGGVKNYWAIWPFLPRETRGYVPAFTAVTYVMNYAPEHNLYPLDPGILFNGIDTVMVNEPLAFDQVAERLNIPIEDVRFLNPLYKKEIIPVKDDQRFFLRLPREFIGDFIEYEDEIYNFKTKSGMEREKLLALIKQAQERQIHIVRSGENLGLIARRYRVYVSQLQRWNNLRGTTIYPGQRLVVYPSPSYDPGYPASKSTAKQSSDIKDKQIHTVRYGENLGLIAKKYGCTVSQLKSWNSISGSTIHPNQKLIVYARDGKESTAGKSYVYHTVKKGDTLWDIAKKYKGATVSEIKALNNITNSYRLRPGQKLKVAVDG